MADEEQTQDEQATEQAGKGKSKRRLPIWIAVIVAVELIAAMAVVNVLVPTQESEEPEAWLEAAEPIERDIPNVVVNLRDGNAKRMLCVHVTIRIFAEKPALAEAAIGRPGVIEDRLSTLLCKKRLPDVAGRQAEIKAEIREMLEREVFTTAWRKKNGEVQIDELLMPKFVIQ